MKFQPNDGIGMEISQKRRWAGAAVEPDWPEPLPDHWPSPEPADNRPSSSGLPVGWSRTASVARHASRPRTCRGAATSCRHRRPGSLLRSPRRTVRPWARRRQSIAGMRPVGRPRGDHYPRS